MKPGGRSQVDFVTVTGGVTPLEVPIKLSTGPATMRIGGMRSSTPNPIIISVLDRDMEQTPSADVPESRS